MKNKAQSNALKLLKILAENRYKKKKTPFVMMLGVLAALVIVVTISRNNRMSQESYLISREDKLSYKDIDDSIAKGVNFESLGEGNKHILYFLAKAPYSLEVLSYLKKSGVKLNKKNSKNKTPLEDILLSLETSHKNLEEHFLGNIKILINLGMTASDNTIKEASEKCAENSLITCLKVALYFKALGKEDHANSYAKRSCYTSKDESICVIAKKHILKEK